MLPRKKACLKAGLSELGAEGENRTPTGFPLPDFESGASTGFATSARINNYTKFTNASKDGCIRAIFLAIFPPN